MTSTARPPEPARIAVFARAPVPGAVKTRLAAALGDAGAARLHEDLVRHALETATLSEAGAVELWCAPDATHPFFEECARSFGVALRTQSGADLGERMQNAAAHAHAAGRSIVIVGADCPALTPSHLRIAANALRAHDAVLIPAEDGGYVLVALAKPVNGLFAGIRWGGDTVMEDTRARLAAAGVHWLELPPLWDVDRPEDYARLQHEELLSRERA